MTGNQVVSTMFDISTSIHVSIIVPFRDQDEDLGNPSGTHLYYVPHQGCDGDYLSLRCEKSLP
jgi:hypothetical protein